MAVLSKPHGLRKVIIVGAGPVGLLLALRLAQQKINVQVLELAAEVDHRPRATHYGPAGVYELRRAGVLDEVRRQGSRPGDMAFRRLDGTYLAGLKQEEVVEDLDRHACLPIHKLGLIIVNALAKEPTAEISWRHAVTAMGESADGSLAWVEVESPEGSKRLEADYIVGCDGAKSVVRKSMFGDNFPGYTWDKTIVATNVEIDLDPFNWGDASFIIDKEHYGLIIRVNELPGDKAVWRVTYGDIPGLTHEEYVARVAMKYRALLPGNPTPDQYKMTHISPYKVHQRLVEKMRVGRFVLAGDAAHLNNPL
jgi:2-polyprenyl-6-methoxyphenol hydroxylase-like FAD-dependent oxidoreductase